MQEENSDILRDFSFRLDQAATRAGLSQAEIAAKLGLRDGGSGRVNNWFKARNFPRSAERPKLAAILGVRPDWLFFGKGDPQKITDKSESGDADAPGFEMREVPVVSWAHAGQATSYEEIPKDSRSMVRSGSRDPRAFAVTVEGDSMEPKVFQGDRVICEPSRHPINGKPVVAKYDNEDVQLRIYHKLPNGKIRLAPLNSVYPTIEYELDEFHWIYPVLELVRSF